MKSKADLHNHWKTSRNIPSQKAIVKTVRKNLGERGVAGITNYEDDRFEKFYSEKQYKSDKGENYIWFPNKKVLFVKVQEIPTQHGDLLAVGMPLGKNLKSRKDLHDTLKRIQDLGAVSVACYENIPYLEQNPKTINDLDAIETWNAEANLWLPGITQRKANKKAQEFYNEFKKDFPHLGKIISSDGHSLYEIGKTHMEIDFPDLSSMHNLNESLK